MLEDVKQQLLSFIQRNKDKKFNSNAWIGNEIMQVYIRKSFRLFGNKLQPVLDLATIEVQEKYRGKGLFSDFLDYAHSINPWFATYIENVLNEDFQSYFRKLGWEEDSKVKPPSFYKLKG